MLVHELTTRECAEILKKTRIARLACARDNQPYVVPVHIYFDGDCLYSFAMLGQKIEWMRENPSVCVQVDDIRDRFHWATVVVFGKFEELLHMPRHEEARRRAHELFQTVPDWWEPAASNIGPAAIRMAVVYRIRIDSMTGRLAERGERRVDEKPWWLGVLFEPTDGGRQDT